MRRYSRRPSSASESVSASRLCQQREEFLPRLRQLDAALPLSAQEQRRPHALLKRADAHGERGLGDIERFGRGGHRPVLHHGPECLDVEVCHAAVPPKIYQDVFIFYSNTINFTSQYFCVIVTHTKGTGAAAAFPRSASEGLIQNRAVLPLFGLVICFPPRAGADSSPAGRSPFRCRSDCRIEVARFGPPGSFFHLLFFSSFFLSITEKASDTVWRLFCIYPSGGPVWNSFS